MNLPSADDRVNLSLAEIIQLSQAEKKKANKKKGKKNNNKNNNNQAAGNNNNGNAAASAVKQAKVVGAGKAKRAAMNANKRGLAASAHASKMEIDNAVQKQVAKAVNGGQNNGGNKNKNKQLKKKPLVKTGGIKNRNGNANAGNGNKAGGPNAQGSNVRISFVTKDVAKGTDKTMIAQVRAVLKKGAAAQKQQQNRPNSAPAQAGRSVQITNQQKQKQGGNRNNK